MRQMKGCDSVVSDIILNDIMGMDHECPGVRNIYGDIGN